MRRIFTLFIAIAASIFTNAQLSQTKISTNQTTLSIPGSSSSWTNLANVGLNDASSASANINKEQYTDYLILKDFGFSIPIGTSVTGIEVSIRRKFIGNGDCMDRNIQLIKGGTITATNKAITNSYWPYTTATTVVYGGRPIHGLKLSLLRMLIVKILGLPLQYQEVNPVQRTPKIPL